MVVETLIAPVAEFVETYGPFEVKEDATTVALVSPKFDVEFRKSGDGARIVEAAMYGDVGSRGREDRGWTRALLPAVGRYSICGTHRRYTTVAKDFRAMVRGIVEAAIY